MFSGIRRCKWSLLLQWTHFRSVPLQLKQVFSFRRSDDLPSAPWCSDLESEIFLRTLTIVRKTYSSLIILFSRVSVDSSTLILDTFFCLNVLFLSSCCRLCSVTFSISFSSLNVLNNAYIDCPPSLCLQESTLL